MSFQVTTVLLFHILNDNTSLFIPFVQLNDVEGSLLVHFTSKLIIVLSNMWVALMLCFSGSDRFYGLCVQLSHGCALLEPGDLWDTISSALE